MRGGAGVIDMDNFSDRPAGQQRWPARLGSKNARRHVRYNAMLSVHELGHPRHNFSATDVSLGGIFCPAAPHRKVGSDMLVEIDLCDGKVPFVAPVTVARRGGDGTPAGTGLAFRSPQPQLRAFIRGLAASQAAVP